MAYNSNMFIFNSKYLLGLIVVYTCVFVCITCYNIEDRSTKVGISRGEENSQYGYSVAFVKKPGWAAADFERTAWTEKVLLVGAPNKTVTRQVRTKKVTEAGPDIFWTTENATIKGHGEVQKCFSPDNQTWNCSAIDLGINLCDKLRVPEYNQLPGVEKSHCEEDQRMGATIAVNRNFVNVLYRTSTMPMVTICGPGWKNVYFEFKEGNYQKYMVGICMKLRDQLTQLDCLARNDYTYCWPFWPVQGKLFQDGPIYTYAQNGFAADFTRDGTSELITGPGVDNWQGGYMAYQLNWEKRVNVEEMSTLYYGYSITGAKFKAGANVAVGIPNFYHKSYGHFGKVEVLVGTNKVDLMEFGHKSGAETCPGVKTLNPPKYVKDKQMGTKFGASVAAIDITGDGYDELFVGAPLYSGEYPDEGRVFVYTTDDYDGYFSICGPVGILSGGARIASLKRMSKFARFGNTIATAGDLNVDGFNDFAIGAPYEDEGSGAVYIYHGLDLSGVTMDDMFAQRIAGKSIEPTIKAFGWHIYGDDDVDGNGFPDLAVGAYASDHAVVLRTRPIVVIYAHMKINPRLIPLNASQLRCSSDGIQLCMDVTVSFRYQVLGPATTQTFENITISWEMFTDTVYKQREGTSRLAFRDTDSDFRVETISLPPQSREYYDELKHYTLDVKKYKNKPEPKDAWTVVRLKGQFSLPKRQDSPFGFLDPVLRKDVDRHIVGNAEFDKKCESLDKCVSDLKTSVKLFLLNSGGQVTAINQSSLLIVGGSTELQMQVDVLNRQDSSYRSNFTADVGLPIRRSVESELGAIDATCTKHDSTRYTTNINCTADSSLDKNENIRVAAFFDTSRDQLIPGGDMDKMRRSVEVDVMAGQANQDVDLSNNDFHASIEVRLKYDVDVTEDKETSDQVRYKSDERSERMLPIIHRYYITNNGPSFLPKTYVNITVPLRKDKEVIAIIKKVSSICIVRGTAPILQTTPTTPPTTPPTAERVTIPEPESNRKKREVAADSSPDSGSESDSGNPTETKPTQESTNSKNITCVDYVCATIECKIENLEKNEHEIINVTIDIVEKVIAKEKNTREVRYSTVATVTDPVVWYGGKVVSWDKTVFGEKWTTLIVEPATVAEEVNIWIIIGSVLGALLLLIIVVVILWRCGFFNRKKHTEVQKWKQDSLYKRRSQAPGTSMGNKNSEPPYKDIDKPE